MKKELLKELYGLRKQIMFLPNSIKRDYLLLDYSHLYKYLEYLNLNLDDDLLDFDNTDRVNKITDDGIYLQIGEFILNNDYLLRRINEILKTYHKHNFYAENSLPTKINQKDIGKVLDDFFKYLGSDIYKLYRRLLKETFIGYGVSMDADALTFHRMFDKLSNVMMCCDGKELLDYNSFVHEIGHVYQFYLQRNGKYLSDLHYGTEITSRLFEKLFRKYLLDNHLYNKQIDNTISSYHYQNINMYGVCSLICEIVRTGNFMIDDTSVKSELDEEELRRRLMNKIGFIYDYTLDLDYNSFLYVIGDIISSNFYKEINDNKEEGFRKLRDYLVRLDDLSIKESFKLYGNMDNAKEYINNDIKILRKV